MTIYFRGGEYQQRGRGIGGFFRGLWNLFRPVAKSVGSSIVKAATSDTAKSIAKTLGEQALDSTLNMTKDAIAGNDLQSSLDREVGHFKRKGTDIITEIQTKRAKTNQKGSGKKKTTALSAMKKYGGKN